MPDLPPIKKLTIVGLGIMGGSLLLSLRNKGIPVHITALCRSESSLSWGKKHGADVCSTELKDIPPDTDLLVLAVPNSALRSMAEVIGQMTFKSTLVTDVASAKSEITRDLSAKLKSLPYLSCHPMCGSEKTGNSGATDQLYENKTVILTPHNEDSKTHIDRLATFWHTLGSRTLTLDPEEHDASVAWVSHMPHLMIAALIKTISRGEEKNPDLFKVAGTGLRDISRLAASNPSLWTEIIIDNKAPVLDSLKAMRDECGALIKLLGAIDDKNAVDLESYFSEARRILLDHNLNK